MPDLKGRLIVIRDNLPREDSFQSWVSSNSQWPDTKFSVQDFTKAKDADHSVETPYFAEIVPALQDPNPRILSPENPPLNLLNLAPRTYRPRPRCLEQNRFTLIQQLVSEARRYATKDAGKTVESRSGNCVPTDFEDCLTFEIAGQAYSSSLYHEDSAGVGTWIRCECGLQLWPIIPCLDRKQTENFIAMGEDWEPDDVSVFALFPGDTLIMVPENDNAHAPIKMQDCVMTGGMFWDNENIGYTLMKILRQRTSRRVSNEEIASQIGYVLQALLFRARRSHDLKVENLCSDILNLLPNCDCDGPGKCINSCPCRAGGVDCTVACHVGFSCPNGAWEGAKEGKSRSKRASSKKGGVSTN